MNQYLSAATTTEQAPQTFSGEPAMVNPHGFWGDRRIGRSRFIYFSLITGLFGTTLAILCLRVAELYQLPSIDNMHALWALPGIWFAFMYLSHQVGRRLNDLNLSRLWSALLLIPLLNIVVFVYLASHPGNQGNNNHGAPDADPLPAISSLAFLALHIALLNFSLTLTLNTY